MEGFVYLIRNIDLFKIGHTGNLERRMQQLRPTELLAAAMTTESRNVEALLHKRFAHSRLPQSEYFRLAEAEVEEAKRIILEFEANRTGQVALELPKRKKPIFSNSNSSSGIGTLTEAKRIISRVSFSHKGCNICIFQYPYYVYSQDGICDSMAATAWNVAVLLEYDCEILPKGRARRLVNQVKYHFASIDHMMAKTDSPVDSAYQEKLFS